MKAGGVVTAALVLVGCVDAHAPQPRATTPGATAPSPATSPASPLAAPVQMQEYVPGGGGKSRAPSSSKADAPPASSSAANKRGGGTAPDLLAPNPPVANPPALVPSPGARNSTGDTARFKQDLLQPEVDNLKRQNDLGRLDPIQKRDLFNREQEINRLQTDPMRR